MQYGVPKCYDCKFLTKTPKKVGEKASCSKYAKVPDSIFFQAGNCSHFKKK